MQYLVTLLLIWVSTLVFSIRSHTWVENVNLIGSDGSFQDTGYARGFGGRLPGIDPDKTNTYLLPPNGRSGNEILPTDLICKETQTKQKQSSGFPRLSAAPNDHVSLAYHENGHVTKFNIQDGKPAGRGTVFIYGTKNPSPNDKYLDIHRVWNVNGTGGDKRGKLLASRPFDDGQCYQPNDEQVSHNRAQRLGFSNVNQSPEILCQSAVQIPSDAGINGTYTLYWVWEWPTLDQSGEIFKNESYTSCIDINMVEKPAAKTLNIQEVKKGAANSVAVKSQLKSDKQFMVDPDAPPRIASDNPPKQGSLAYTKGKKEASKVFDKAFEDVPATHKPVIKKKMKSDDITHDKISSDSYDNNYQKDSKSIKSRDSCDSLIPEIGARFIHFPRRGLS